MLLVFAARDFSKNNSSESLRSACSKFIILMKFLKKLMPTMSSKLFITISISAVDINGWIGSRQLKNDSSTLIYLMAGVPMPRWKSLIPRGRPSSSMLI